MRCRLTTLFLFLLIIAALPVQALDEVRAVYDSGTYHFDYDQWPFGSYGGTFQASGPILDPDIGWAPGQTESSGGRYEVIGDTLTSWAYSARLNTDETVDLAALLVRTAADTLLPGSYPIDLDNYLVEYAFLDDVTNFTFPEYGGDMVAWLNSLISAHRFLGTTGTIHVTEVGSTGFAGTFSGTMTDPDDFTIISISGGTFDLEGHWAVDAPPVVALADHGSFPNPFNPKTTLRLVLAEETPLRVSVLDVTGRQVKLLADLDRVHGEVNLIWNGDDTAGRRQPAGVYFYRVATSQGVESGKMVLLP